MLVAASEQARAVNRSTKSYPAGRIVSLDQAVMCFFLDLQPFPFKTDRAQRGRDMGERDGCSPGQADPVSDGDTDESSIIWAGRSAKTWWHHRRLGS